ncbi:MAG: sigma 54-interacting transcriptional regulator [Myxococcota bacterium]
MNPRSSEYEATLSVLREGVEKIIVRIEKGEFRVGASLLCDISIPQSGLDDFHFEIIAKGNTYLLRPLAKGRISINNKEIEKETTLKDDDRIKAGNLDFHFHVKGTTSSGSTAILQEDSEESIQKRAYLVILSDEGEKVFEINSKGQTTLGSGEKADIRIKDKYVSENHCTFFVYRNTYFIRDNLSKNGTFVNGVRTREAEVKSGSVIRVGKTELLFRIESTGHGVAIEDTDEFCGIIGFSVQMKELFGLIKKVAPTDIPVLITGESGTGKELVARAIFKNSRRVDKVFIPLNCSSISREVMESELFGHIKGAFTGAISNRKGIFEEATDGTVFLDEIGDMPIDLQAKILRTIEYGEVRPVGSNKPIIVNTRIISATNKDLLRASRSDQFREDLYYRLGVVHLYIPSLRERREDIIPVAEAFLRRFAPSREIHLTQGAKEKLLAYNWPGNVRELKNVIIRSILFSKENTIDDSAIIFQSTGLKDYMNYADRFIRVKPLVQVEREIISNAMNIYNGDLNLVAKRLDISVSELKEKLKSYGK